MNSKACFKNKTIITKYCHLTLKEVLLPSGSWNRFMVYYGPCLPVQTWSPEKLLSIWQTLLLFQREP